jgi:CRP-like cAMP-binding protein
MSGHAQSYTRNLLLRACSSADFALIQPDLKRVDLALRQSLFVTDETIEHVYFLEGGLGSIVARQDDGVDIEVRCSDPTGRRSQPPPLLHAAGSSDGPLHPGRSSDVRL